MPAHADPFFVTVYGRTYKVDPRFPSNEAQGAKPQEALRALPPDIAKGPGFRPSHEQVLAEVEERTWIARHQLEDALEKTSAPCEGWSTGAAGTAVTPEITGSLATEAAHARSPEVQRLYDRQRALNLLARELRRSMDLPGKLPETGFSRPKLAPDVEADYRARNFDPLEAYYGFRRVKAAFRSSDIELLADVAHYPMTINGKIKRTIRNRDQLIAAERWSWIRGSGISSHNPPSRHSSLAGITMDSVQEPAAPIQCQQGRVEKPVHQLYMGPSAGGGIETVDVDAVPPRVALPVSCATRHR